MNIDFCKLEPRLGRIKFLGLASFWIGVLLLDFLIVALPYDDAPFIGYSAIVPLVASGINLLFLKIRRLNDFNFSGWWLLLCVFPLVGIVGFLILLLIPGSKGKNRFGSKADMPKLSDGILIVVAPAMLLILYACSFTSYLKSLSSLFSMSW
ncbi:MAG: DUF805 domain-containing protein [Gammaproteobacteria bacterium]